MNELEGKKVNLDFEKERILRENYKYKEEIKRLSVLPNEEMDLNQLDNFRRGTVDDNHCRR
jgi:hypothetical protein